MCSVAVFGGIVHGFEINFGVFWGTWFGVVLGLSMDPSNRKA